MRNIIAKYLKNSFHKLILLLREIGLLKRDLTKGKKTKVIKNHNRFSIDYDSFVDRAKNIGNESVKMMYSFSKGIGLTTGTIVFFRLFRTIHLDSNLSFDFNLIIMFIMLAISFVVLLITYDAIMFGAIFIIKIPPMWATLFPSIFVFFEFFSFAILSSSLFLNNGVPDIDEKEYLTIYWFLIIGIYHLLISKFCSKAVDLIEDDVNSFTPNNKLNGIYKKYQEHIENERIFTFWVGLTSLILFVILYNSPNKTGNNTFIIIQLIASFTLLLFVTFGYTQQFKKRNDVYDEIDKNK